MPIIDEHIGQAMTDYRRLSIPGAAYFLYRAGRLDWADLVPGVQRWIGHARHAETIGLRGAIFGPVAFDRDGWYIL